MSINVRVGNHRRKSIVSEAVAGKRDSDDPRRSVRLGGSSGPRDSAAVRFKFPRGVRHERLAVFESLHVATRRHTRERQEAVFGALINILPRDSAPFALVEEWRVGGCGGVLCRTGWWGALVGLSASWVGRDVESVLM